jgi:hypothetical protein
MRTTQHIVMCLSFLLPFYLFGICQNWVRFCWSEETREGKVRGSLFLFRRSMGHEGGLQNIQLPFELLPSLGQGNKLVRRSPGPEIVSQLIERAAEALRGSKALKTQHRVVALFEAPVILLDPIIFVAAAPMLPLFPSTSAMARGYELCPSVVTCSGRRPATV